MALGLRPQNALLGDVNPHTINFYQQLQRGFRISAFTMRNERQHYDRARTEFNRLVTSRGAGTKKAAALFYYLNRTGFNGLCRFNKSGEFNVPFGQHRTINYVRDFRHYSATLKDWSFVCADFAEMKLRDDDFVYVDPPYDVPFTRCAAGGFDWRQQVRLVRWLDQHRGPVVASNQATERIVKLYEDSGFDVTTLPAPRAISRTGDRTPALEMLATRGLSRRG